MVCPATGETLAQQFDSSNRKALHNRYFAWATNDTSQWLWRLEAKVSKKSIDAFCGAMKLNPKVFDSMRVDGTTFWLPLYTDHDIYLACALAFIDGKQKLCMRVVVLSKVLSKKIGSLYKTQAKDVAFPYNRTANEQSFWCRVAELATPAKSNHQQVPSRFEQMLNEQNQKGAIPIQRATEPSTTGTHSARSSTLSEGQSSITTDSRSGRSTNVTDGQSSKKYGDVGSKNVDGKTCHEDVSRKPSEFVDALQKMRTGRRPSQEITVGDMVRRKRRESEDSLDAEVDVYTEETPKKDSDSPVAGNRRKEAATDDHTRRRPASTPSHGNNDVAGMRRLHTTTSFSNLPSFVLSPEAKQRMLLEKKGKDLPASIPRVSSQLLTRVDGTLYDLTETRSKLLKTASFGSLLRYSAKGIMRPDSDYLGNPWVSRERSTPSSSNCSAKADTSSVLEQNVSPAPQKEDISIPDKISEVSQSTASPRETMHDGTGYTPKSATFELQEETQHESDNHSMNITGDSTKPKKLPTTSNIERGRSGENETTYSGVDFNQGSARTQKIMSNTALLHTQFLGDLETGMKRNNISSSFTKNSSDMATRSAQERTKGDSATRYVESGGGSDTGVKLMNSSNMSTKEISDIDMLSGSRTGNRMHPEEYSMITHTCNAVNIQGHQSTTSTRDGFAEAESYQDQQNQFCRTPQTGPDSTSRGITNVSSSMDGNVKTGADKCTTVNQVKASAPCAVQRSSANNMNLSSISPSMPSKEVQHLQNADSDRQVTLSKSLPIEHSHLSHNVAISEKYGKRLGDKSCRTDPCNGSLVGQTKSGPEITNRTNGSYLQEPSYDRSELGSGQQPPRSSFPADEYSSPDTSNANLNTNDKYLKAKLHEEKVTFAKPANETQNKLPQQGTMQQKSQLTSMPFDVDQVQQSVSTPTSPYPRPRKMKVQPSHKFKPPLKSTQFKPNSKPLTYSTVSNDGNLMAAEHNNQQRNKDTNSYEDRVKDEKFKTLRRPQSKKKVAEIRFGDTNNSDNSTAMPSAPKFRAHVAKKIPLRNQSKTSRQSEFEISGSLKSSQLPESAVSSPSEDVFHDTEFKGYTGKAQARAVSRSVQEVSLPHEENRTTEMHGYPQDQVSVQAVNSNVSTNHHGQLERQQPSDIRSMARASAYQFGYENTGGAVTPPAQKSSFPHGTNKPKEVDDCLQDQSYVQAFNSNLDKRSANSAYKKKHLERQQPSGVRTMARESARHSGFDNSSSGLLHATGTENAIGLGSILNPKNDGRKDSSHNTEHWGTENTVHEPDKAYLRVKVSPHQHFDRASFAPQEEDMLVSPVRSQRSTVAEELRGAAWQFIGRVVSSEQQNTPIEKPEVKESSQTLTEGNKEINRSQILPQQSSPRSFQIFPEVSPAVSRQKIPRVQRTQDALPPKAKSAKKESKELEATKHLDDGMIVFPDAGSCNATAMEEISLSKERSTTTATKYPVKESTQKHDQPKDGGEKTIVAGKYNSYHSRFPRTGVSSSWTQYTMARQLEGDDATSTDKPRFSLKKIREVASDVAH